MSGPDPTRSQARRFSPPVQPVQATQRPAPSMHIPKSQRWLFWIMLLLVVAMAVFLIRLRERASDHFAAAAQPLPLSGPESHEEPLRLYLANDLDGSLAERPIRFPLPTDANARARVVLEKLIEEYAAAGSLHPLGVSTGVEEVYLLPVPGLHDSRSQLAVVNLTPAFAQNHPSGIEPETLTLLSMIATLHANLPSVAQVRFLVDGQQQATLAGHADLTRSYLAVSTEMTAEPAAQAEARGAGVRSMNTSAAGAQP